MTASIREQPPLERRSRRGRHAGRFSPLASIGLTLPLFITFLLGFLVPVARLVLLSLDDNGAHYLRIVRDPLYLNVLTTTILMAGTVTILCLALGYPVAFAMTRLSRRWAAIVAIGVFVPLWTSVLIRSYAWIVLLQRNGLVNSALVEVGLIDQPQRLLYTPAAVVLGMTHILLPFAILPIHAALKTVPKNLSKAAANLGAGPMRTLVLITMPLSLPGVFAGAILCFVLALGFYITPALIGGPGSLLMATLIGQQTTVLLDWPFAAALATVLLAVTLLIVLLFHKALSLSKGLHHVH